jgi:hypothetical protein
MKHLNIHFQHVLSAQRNISMLLGKIEAPWHVEFTGGSRAAKEDAPA